MTEHDLIESYGYYMTIPNIQMWRFKKELIPNKYYSYFKKNPCIEGNYWHLSFEEFKDKYNRDIEFRDFIDERKFRLLIEDYIIKNARMSISTPGDEYYGGRYSGTYTISITWNGMPRPFLIQTDNVTCN